MTEFYLMHNEKYHFEVGFPLAFKTQLPKGTQALQYSPHAVAEAKGDKYGDFSQNLPQLINFSTAYIFEAESENRVLKKIACRVPYNDQYDIVMAVSTKDNRNLLVKTVWLNDKADTHKTLDGSRYNTPDDF